MKKTVKTEEATTEQLLLAKALASFLPSLACVACSKTKWHATPFSRYYIDVDLKPDPSAGGSQALAVAFIDVIALSCGNCGHLMFFSKSKVEAIARRSLEAATEPPEPATPAKDPK